MGKSETEPDLFEIDKNNLDEEWVKFPARYYKAAKAHAEASDAYERACSKLKVVTAELDNAIRRNPKEFGLNKMTETALDRVLILQPRYVRVQDQMFRTKHDLNVCQAEVKTLDHLRYSLDGTTRLALSEYFSVDAKPRVPPEERKRLDEVSRQHAFKDKHKIRRGE